MAVRKELHELVGIKEKGHLPDPESFERDKNNEGEDIFISNLEADVNQIDNFALIEQVIKVVNLRQKVSNILITV